MPTSKNKGNITNSKKKNNKNMSFTKKRFIKQYKINIILKLKNESSYDQNQHNKRQINNKNAHNTTKKLLMLSMPKL